MKLSANQLYKVTDTNGVLVLIKLPLLAWDSSFQLHLFWEQIIVPPPPPPLHLDFFRVFCILQLQSQKMGDFD